MADRPCKGQRPTTLTCWHDHQCLIRFVASRHAKIRTGVSTHVHEHLLTGQTLCEHDHLSDCTKGICTEAWASYWFILSVNLTNLQEFCDSVHLSTRDNLSLLQSQVQSFSPHLTTSRSSSQILCCRKRRKTSSNLWAFPAQYPLHFLLGKLFQRCELYRTSRTRNRHSDHT